MILKQGFNCKISNLSFKLCRTLALQEQDWESLAGWYIASLRPEILKKKKNLSANSFYGFTKIPPGA